ncbi:MAG: hypothetical protein K8R53_11365 [Bacteroidales bacterium]|nr:hypothetical protein [Bacteroidales bacterium]
MSIIVVTEFEYNKAKALFSTAKDFECIPVSNHEEALADAIHASGAKHVIVGVDKYTSSLYKALSPGGVIARLGVGYDGIDTNKATEAGLYCTNTPDVLNDSVAEFTIALILSAARNIITQATNCKTGMWNPVIGSELRNKNLTIVGCGPIGRRVAQIAAFGFQMKVIGCETLDVDMEQMKNEYGFMAITKDFGKAVENADFISMHIPSNNATRHFINHERLNMVPAKAWLINTARGAIVDEKALFNALSSEKLAGAILDVFETEPYMPVSSDEDLRKLKNVILTPHIASSTHESSQRAAKKCLLNIEHAEAGEYHKMDLLNPEVKSL